MHAPELDMRPQVVSLFAVWQKKAIFLMEVLTLRLVTASQFEQRVSGINFKVNQCGEVGEESTSSRTLG